RGTSLVGADLRGTILTGARLVETLCDWRWSAIPAELLRQHPGSSAEGSRLVVALALPDDPRPRGWLEMLGGHGLLADWPLRILAGWVRDGDNAPDLLRCLAADAAGAGRAPGGDIKASIHPGHEPTTASAGPQSAPRMRWTRKK